MTTPEENKTLTLGDLDAKLNEVRINRAEKILELLAEKRAVVEKSGKEDIEKIEQELEELKNGVDDLPEVAKKVVEEKIANLTKDLEQKKFFDLETIDRHAAVIKEKLAVFRLYGL